MRGLSDSTDAPIGVEAASAGSVRNGRDPRQVLTETLRSAVGRHGEGVVLLCSFQKEESVLIDELLAIGDGSTPVRVVTIDTGVLFPETLATWKRFEEAFGVAIEVQDASSAEEPWSGPDHCCSAEKVAALERALAGAQAWITGVRRSQSPTRADALPVEEDAARGLIKYNPLAYWSDKDIWQRIYERELPYHPLHDQGYESIGCAPCTKPGTGREGRWAGMEKTECGLHLDPAASRPTLPANAR